MAAFENADSAFTSGPPFLPFLEPAFLLTLNAAVPRFGLSREVVDTVQDERRNNVEEDSPGG
jgi:hypothetical protein